MDNADKLHAELKELRARIKPQVEWSSMQDRLEQKAIEQRVRILQSYLDERTGNEGRS